MTEASFADVVEFHTDLEEVFALHQEALIELRLELARDVLAAYRALLGLHMKHEEERLLPVFDRAGRIEKWPRALYTGQHEKMLGLLERAAAGLDGMIASPPDNLRRSVIALLDFETTYKHLHEHHDGAERQGLFPTCDKVSEPAERRELLLAFRRDWRVALGGHSEVLDAVRRTLAHARHPSWD